MARCITPEEYLDAECEALNKSEYYDGYVCPRARRSPRAVGLAVNLIAELGLALKGRSCQVFSSDMRVFIPVTSLFMTRSTPESSHSRADGGA